MLELKAGRWQRNLGAKLIEIIMMLTRRICFGLAARLRYAPSPTGPMHLGGLRTALFNYLLARKLRGQFIVRIEDTDRNREVDGSIKDIFEALDWIGITPHESTQQGGDFGPYIQSQRLGLYKEIEQQLLKTNKAFPCFCPENDTERHPYNGHCRSLSIEQIKEKVQNKTPFAIRIKGDLVPLPTSFKDQVFGQLQLRPVDDFVIVRRNGWPTFHFANVVDDWHMKITHVMRGEEWLTNTNKHIYLYTLLKAPQPKWMHLPLIKASNGKKLAKRDPESSLALFRQQRYEVEAVRSFLFCLGHNRSETPLKQAGSEGSKQEGRGKKQEHLRLFSWEEMVQQFDPRHLTRVPVRFDQKQLDFLNRLALKARWQKAQHSQAEMQLFLTQVREIVPASRQFEPSYLTGMLAAVVDRLRTISDLANYAYFFQKPNYLASDSLRDFQVLFGAQSLLFQEQSALKGSGCDARLFERNQKIIHNLRMILDHVIGPSEFSEAEFSKRISEFLFQSPQLRNEEVFHLLRYMVTGRKEGPNIVQACFVIGRQELLARLALFSAL